VAGRGGDRAAAPGRLGSGVRKKKGRGGERLTGGAQMLASAGKRKREEGDGPLQEGFGGPAGRLGRREGR
jgi:hypothetical protein